MGRNVMLENANKVAYLIHQYPDRSLPEIINLLELPGVEINTAIWLATELGWISEPDKDEGAVRALDAPKDGWQFGERTTNLMDMLVYAFEKLEKKEQDLEENYLSNWTAGYATHDVMIAMRYLSKTGKLVDYEVQDGENKYTFYTLERNVEQRWGEKQFKQPPKAEAETPAPDAPTEE